MQSTGKDDERRRTGIEMNGEKQGPDLIDLRRPLEESNVIGVSNLALSDN